MPTIPKESPITLEQLSQLYKLLEKQGAFLFTDQQLEVMKGDGKATLIEPMTDEQYAKWEHEQDRGWKKVYDRLLNRGN